MKRPLTLLKKILQSKDEKFCLLDDYFVPFEMTSISLIRNINNEKEWNGEDKDGNVIKMITRDTYLFIGIGENEVSAIKNIKRIAYFNIPEINIEDINNYLGIKLPELYLD